MKKLLSMLLSLLMVFTIIHPVYANSYLTQADRKVQQIQELASLAGQEARDGNYEAARLYEKRICDLGGEILSYREAVATVANMSGISPSSIEINPPPNSDYVHFTKVTTTGYNYGGKSYDIITITATSWNDRSGYLHSEGAIKTKSPEKYTLAGMAASAALAKTVFGSIVTPLMTMGDVFTAIGDSISNYTTMSINKGDGVCLYSIDMDVNFQWIRPHGNGDYRMMVREAQYSEVNYSTSVIASVTRTNGKVDTSTNSKDYQTSKKPAGYGSLTRVCQAYLNGKLAEYHVEAFSITIGGTSVNIAPLPVPPYMDII